MPYYIPPDYLDNTPKRQLAEALRRIIIDMEQRRLDVATGFFDPRIWESLGEALPLLEEFRMLLGKEPELESAGGEAALDLRRYYRQKLQGELGGCKINCVNGLS